MRRTGVPGLVAAIAVLAAMVTMVVPSRAQPVNLTFSFVCGEDELPAWQGIVDAWNQHSSDIRVEVERIAGSWGDYREQMLVKTASGVVPDIGRMGVALMPGMIESGALCDLQPYAVRDPAFNAANYFPLALQQHTDGEHLWGMPISILPLAYYTNATLFDERGVALPERNWAKTWTWNEWRQVLGKLSFGEDPQRTYGVHIEPWIERSIQFLWQNGADIFNAERTHSGYGDPRSVEVLALFSELWHEHRVAWTSSAGAGWGDLYHEGRLGMFADGPWMIPWTHSAPVRTVVLPFPRGTAGPATTSFVDAYVVFSGSKHQDLAWKVVRFFTEQTAVEVQVSHGSMGVPVRRDLAAKMVKDLFPGLANEDEQVWLAAVDYSRPMPFTSNWSELVDKAIGPQMDRLFRNEISAKEAAEIIDDMINSRM